MKRIREDLRQCKKKIQRLTEENKSLKRSKNSLAQKIKNYENMLVFQVELKQKVKYYRDKYHNALEMIEKARKEVKQTGNLEEESAQKGLETSLKCSLCGETRNLKGADKEKYESMHAQFKIIQKFKINGAKNKKKREVYKYNTIY